MRLVKIVVPPDKSISHRAVMLASISEGTTRIKNLLMGDDVLCTIGAFREMGVRIKFQIPNSKSQSADIYVYGGGMHGFKKPRHPLYLGNSGTTMRILPGILAGQDFEVTLEGDKSLSKRPMQRITEPLREMGADVRVKGGEVYPPLIIKGTKILKPINYKSRIASAQVKSCILLAGLFADGVTSVSEPVKSRDHTERMMRIFGVRCTVDGLRCAVKGPARLKSPGIIEIPGDISSAAFFIVAGCILPEIKIVIKNVGLNPTRTGVIDILKRMGADIKFQIPNSKSQSANLEPIGDIVVKSSKLKGIVISPEEVVRAIDEIPIIMVAGCFAKGRTIVKGIGELRVKETDRIKSMKAGLRKLGADVKVHKCISAKVHKLKEEVVIEGGRVLHGARVSSFGDHRTAMSMLIAGLAAKGKVAVTGLGCISKSFPGFENILRKLK